MDDFTTVNRLGWDEMASIHAASPGYSVHEFLADPQHISDVVRFDLPRIGDVAGLEGVHLQCHIGTDTISLARLGARMTGLDFSGTAVEEARRLALAAGADVEVVQAEVYDAPAVLGTARFDLVFTGVGALCWLPDVRRWAAVVAALLRPGGRLFLREGHPMLWTLEDSRSDGLLVVQDPYFETPEPVATDDPGSYADPDAVLENTRTYTWNHGIGEIITALLDAGLTITAFVEHDSVPWDALGPGSMTLTGRNEWRLADRPERLPHSYTLQATKPGPRPRS